METAVSSQEKIGFIVHLQFKPGGHEEVQQVEQGAVDAMIQEPAFINYFQLQDEADPTRFALYETWKGNKETFLDVEMKRPHRREFEELTRRVVQKPSEMQMNWRLLRSDTNFRASRQAQKFGFFVYSQTKPGFEDEYHTKVNYVLDHMIDAPTFLNCFLLEDKEDPTKFALYETWSGTREEFLSVEMKQPYRRDYEDSLPRLLAKPREVQFNWRLLRAEEASR